MSYISDIGPYFGPDQCGVAFADWFKGENAEALWKHSPLKYVDDAKTPTLFLHSDQDYRCPLPEAMQMMQEQTAEKHADAAMLTGRKRHIRLRRRTESFF